MEINFLPVLEARCPKSKCWQSCAVLEALGENLPLLLAALVAVYVLGQGGITPVSASVVNVFAFPLCVLV